MNGIGVVSFSWAEAQCRQVPDSNLLRSAKPTKIYLLRAAHCRHQRLLVTLGSLLTSSWRLMCTCARLLESLRCIRQSDGSLMNAHCGYWSMRSSRHVWTIAMDCLLTVAWPFANGFSEFRIALLVWYVQNLLLATLHHCCAGYTGYQNQNQKIFNEKLANRNYNIKHRR